MSYKKSDHFDGTQFSNPGLKIDKGLQDVAKWYSQGGRTKWPHWLNDNETPDLQTPFITNELRLTYVNHATHLLQWSDLSILTDPVFSERVSPFMVAGPRRIRAPGIYKEDLPKIQGVLLSHNHYDHLDKKALKWLIRRDNPFFVTPIGNEIHLKNLGAQNVQAFDWWETCSPTPHSTVTVTPAQHWSGRWLNDRNRALWGGFMMTYQGHKVFFAGDSGYSNHFTKIRENLGAPTLALLPIGAYEPRWFMKDQHMNPAEAVQAHLDLEASQSFGTHYGTFQLANEGHEKPLEELAIALKNMNLEPVEFQAPRNGKTVRLHNL